MKITPEKISRYNKPCAAGVVWLARQKDCNLSALIGTVIKNKPFQHEDRTWYPLDFALWALPQLMEKEQAVRYALYAAQLVLKSSDIPSVRSIEAAEAAGVAAAATEAASVAAWAAAWAEWAAEAAEAAAATEAASVAARAAEAAAAKQEIQIKILHYGVNLLLEEQ